MRAITSLHMNADEQVVTSDQPNLGTRGGVTVIAIGSPCGSSIRGVDGEEILLQGAPAARAAFLRRAATEFLRTADALDPDSGPTIPSERYACEQPSSDDAGVSA